MTTAGGGGREGEAARRKLGLVTTTGGVGMRWVGQLKGGGEAVKAKRKLPRFAKWVS